MGAFDGFRHVRFVSPPPRPRRGCCRACHSKSMIRKSRDENEASAQKDQGAYNGADDAANETGVRHASAPRIALAAACTACRIDRQARKGEKPSDHAPVIAELAV